jgi:hypothetical protein
MITSLLWVSHGLLNSANNCNASLPREGCARVVAYYMVCRTSCKQLLHFCGVLDGLADSANNYNASLPREGCAHVVACYIVCRSRRK